MSDAAIEFRELGPEEFGKPVALWADVFPVGERFFTSLLDSCEGASMAAFSDGEIVASVHVFMRHIRDREGRPLKVGGIGSVSTRPDFRKRGISGRLLEMAIGAMEREGCVWSLLGTGVNDHYARYGWRTVSTPSLSGRPRAGLLTTRNFQADEAPLEEMARLYDLSSSGRPMATVRSAQAWRTALLYRLAPQNTTMFGAYDGDRLAAYLVARHETGTAWRLIDAAGDPPRFGELFASAAATLVGWDGDRLDFDLPQTPELVGAFKDAVKDIRPQESRGMMLRPIADRISWPHLFALYGDPRGRHSDLDAF